MAANGCFSPSSLDAEEENAIAEARAKLEAATKKRDLAVEAEDYDAAETFQEQVTLLENKCPLSKDNMQFTINYLNYAGMFVHHFTVKAEDFLSPTVRERQYMLVTPFSAESIDQIDEKFVNPPWVAVYTAALESMMCGPGDAQGGQWCAHPGPQAGALKRTRVAKAPGLTAHPAPRSTRLRPPTRYCQYSTCLLLCL